MRCSSRSPACLLAMAAGVVLALVLATRALDRAPVATSTIDPITDASSPKPRAAESGVRGADPLATPKPRSGEKSGLARRSAQREGGWDRDEWDVTLTDGATYRVFRERDTDAWFIEGVVD